jgi:hypothetical protein
VPKVYLPPGCGGFADGDMKYMAERGPGSYVNIDDTDPAGRAAMRKLAGQDFAQAGLVDAGPEKFFSRRSGDGRWCLGCRRVWNRWNKTCPNEKCGRFGEPTVPESEMTPVRLEGQYAPFGPVCGLTA